MLIYVTPVEDTDVGFFRSKYVEIEQEIPKDATYVRMSLMGHPYPRKVRVESTTDPNIVRVVNNTTHMVQLRTKCVFAVFEVDDPIVDTESYGGPNDVGELVAMFHASEVTFDDHIDTLDLTPALIRALVDEGINFVSELKIATDEELLAIEGIGPVTLDRIRAALDEYAQL